MKAKYLGLEKNQISKNHIPLQWSDVFFAPLQSQCEFGNINGFVIFPKLLQLNFQLNFDVVKKFNIKGIFKTSLYDYYISKIQDKTLARVLINSEGFGFVIYDIINKKTNSEFKKSLIDNTTKAIKLHFSFGMLEGYNKKKFDKVISEIIKKPDL